mgnify:CR=1 FL=1
MLDAVHPRARHAAQPRRGEGRPEHFERIAKQAIGTPGRRSNPRPIAEPAEVREILELAAVEAVRCDEGVSALSATPTAPATALPEISSRIGIRGGFRTPSATPEAALTGRMSAGLTCQRRAGRRIVRERLVAQPTQDAGRLQAVDHLVGSRGQSRTGRAHFARCPRCRDLRSRLRACSQWITRRVWRSWVVARRDQNTAQRAAGNSRATGGLPASTVDRGRWRAAACLPPAPLRQAAQAQPRGAGWCRPAQLYPPAALGAPDLRRKGQPESGRRPSRLLPPRPAPMVFRRADGKPARRCSIVTAGLVFARRLWPRRGGATATDSARQSAPPGRSSPRPARPRRAARRAANPRC